MQELPYRGFDIMIMHKNGGGMVLFAEDRGVGFHASGDTGSAVLLKEICAEIDAYWNTFHERGEENNVD
jgi:hypothetical protein